MQAAKELKLPGSSKNLFDINPDVKVRMQNIESYRYKASYLYFMIAYVSYMGHGQIEEDGTGLTLKDLKILFVERGPNFFDKVSLLSKLIPSGLPAQMPV